MPATQEAEVRGLRSTAKLLSEKLKIKGVGVAQVVGPKFSPQYCQEKNKLCKECIWYFNAF
jgi:hypothetical protein